MHAAYLIPFAILLVPASAQQAPRFHLVDCAAAKPGDSACRVTLTPDITEVLNRLAGKDTVWWRHGDVFTVAARRTSQDLRLCCVFDEPMTRIPGTDLWTLTVRSTDLDGAIIDISVYSNAERSSGNIRTLGLWRGPAAPAAPQEAKPLGGQVQTVEINSPNLGEKRRVDIYLPPGHQSQTRYPVIYMADGRAVGHYAAMLEPFITAKKVPPVILVGLYAGQGNPVPGDTVGRRAADYLFSRVNGDVFFLKHEAFFLKEVIPQIESRFGASPEAKDRLVLGQSFGAAWALDMGLRHPELFSRVIGFSPCWRGGYRQWGADKPKLFVTRGLFEECSEDVATLVQTAKAAGEDVTFVSHASGHTSLMWDVQFVDALSWAYPAR